MTEYGRRVHFLKEYVPADVLGGKQHSISLNDVGSLSKLLSMVF